MINGRNPWLKDPEIDYDMDSEDELAEEQGEDLNSKQNVSGDEDEEMAGGIEEDG